VLDTVEDFIQTSFFPNNAFSDHQGHKHLVDEQSRQQSRPSYFSISPLKIIETKPYWEHRTVIHGRMFPSKTSYG